MPQEKVGMQFLQLIYVSDRDESTDAQQVCSIVSQAVEHNDKYNIKGILVVLPNHFIQVLEGPQFNVLSVMNKITRDRRHANVRVLSEKYIPYYEYGHWSMVSCEVNENRSDELQVLKDVAESNEPESTSLFGLKYMLMGLANPASRLL